MAAALPQPEYSILHLSAGSADWAAVLAQFTLHLTTREGKAYAAWAGDRLLRATREGDGVVALADGQLLGILIFAVDGPVVEITLPWTKAPMDHVLASQLAVAALQVIREKYPRVPHLRAERQLLPGEADPAGLTSAGFECHWRRRMLLELAGWSDDADIPPGYRVVPWHIRYLDAAAAVVFHANLGTLDGRLYATFFGDSPAQCRKGLLAILAGKYGPIHPQATLCAFQGEEPAGVNMVVSEGSGLASVVEISVHPHHQGKGLGRALMVRSLRVLKHENMERVELAVTRANIRAATLYESLGFLDAGDFPVCIWPE